MIAEITIPSPGESISEAVIAKWLVEDGDYVEKDQELAEIESDKATLPLIASVSGVVKLHFKEGVVVKIGAVACTIDDSKEKKTEGKGQSNKKVTNTIEIAKATKIDELPVKSKNQKADKNSEAEQHIKATPLAKKLMDENNLDINDIINGLKKITSKDVEMVLKYSNPNVGNLEKKELLRSVNREPISQLRKKLGKRLISVKNETAMLTTFNEVDMSKVIALRNKYQKQFTEQYGMKLGFMSFFVKACTAALQFFPKVNSQIDADELIYPDFVDIAIAVQTEKGLMVPVLRNTESMSIVDIEKNISVLAEKARSFKLTIEEMTGGTFTITNGGIFGSMLSTPIINPPQSAILGMHNIIERPVAIDGKVDVRPIMYVALSYDHRNIDGRDSVSFLMKIKELIESPYRLLFDAVDPEKMLLGL